MRTSPRRCRPQRPGTHGPAIRLYEPRITHGSTGQFRAAQALLGRQSERQPNDACCLSTGTTASMASYSSPSSDDDPAERGEICGTLAAAGSPSNDKPSGNQHGLPIILTPLLCKPILRPTPFCAKARCYVWRVQASLVPQQSTTAFSTERVRKANV